MTDVKRGLLDNNGATHVIEINSDTDEEANTEVPINPPIMTNLSDLYANTATVFSQKPPPETVVGQKPDHQQTFKVKNFSNHPLSWKFLGHGFVKCPFHKGVTKVKFLNIVKHINKVHKKKRE